MMEAIENAKQTMRKLNDELEVKQRDKEQIKKILREMNPSKK